MYRHTGKLQIKLVISPSHSIHFHLHLSCCLADRWGTTGDFTITSRTSRSFPAFRSMKLHSRPVHSLILSSHRFFFFFFFFFLCLPLRPPPCRIVVASPDDLLTCSHHFCLCLFAEVRSLYGPMAFPILAFTSSLVMYPLYEILGSLRKHLLSNACILLSMSAVMVHVSHAYKHKDMTRERISLILELMAIFLSFQMTFSLPTATLVWAILEGTSGLDPSSDTTSSQIFIATDGLQFLIVYGNVSADAIDATVYRHRRISPSKDLITSGAWQGSHWGTNF